MSSITARLAESSYPKGCYSCCRQPVRNGELVTDVYGCVDGWLGELALRFSLRKANLQIDSVGESVCPIARYWQSSCEVLTQLP